MQIYPTLVLASLVLLTLAPLATATPGLPAPGSTVVYAEATAAAAAIAAAIAPCEAIAAVQGIIDCVSFVVHELTGKVCYVDPGTGQSNCFVCYSFVVMSVGAWTAWVTNPNNNWMPYYDRNFHYAEQWVPGVGYDLSSGNSGPGFHDIAFSDSQRATCY